MATSVLPSTALLTSLLAIGLFFFIRASTKDRIQVMRFCVDVPEASLLEQLQAYFTQRAYRIAAIDAAQNQVTFEGFVRPSVFLAIFLMLLAAIGLLCLALVLAMVLPQWSHVFPVLVLASPGAAFFYWKKSARIEQVLLQVESMAPSPSIVQSQLTVTGHRDELAELQRSLNLKACE